MATPNRPKPYFLEGGGWPVEQVCTFERVPVPNDHPIRPLWDKFLEMLGIMQATDFTAEQMRELSVEAVDAYAAFIDAYNSAHLAARKAR